MALQLNLLHEEITQERQRKRDPLKLGLIALSVFGAVLFVYYGWSAYRTILIKGRLNTAQADWQRVEPKVTAAQKRAAELHQIIDSTKVLDGLIDGRFYWAPFLATVSHCVAPNVQITSLDGNLVETGHSVTVALEGIAAAREPRAAAEDLRQLLIEQLSENSLGIQTRSATETPGVVVEGVTPESPAATAQVQGGDVLRKFDGHAIETFSQLLELAGQTPLNHDVELNLVRNGQRVTTKLQIKQRRPSYSNIEVVFKNLEDLDTLVNLGGVPTASARFVLSVTLDPKPADPAKANEPSKETAQLK